MDLWQLAGQILSKISQDAWAGLGASFGPAMLFSLFWKKTSRNGVLAGILTGGLVVILWKNYLAFTGLYEIIPGFILSGLVIFLISYLGKSPDQEIQDQFETALER